MLLECRVTGDGRPKSGVVERLKVNVTSQSVSEGSVDAGTRSRKAESGCRKLGREIMVGKTSNIFNRWSSVQGSFKSFARYGMKRETRS